MAAPHPTLGMGRLQVCLAAQLVLQGLLGLCKARAKVELEPAPHNLPSCLLHQAGRDGSKPSTVYEWQEKMSLFAEPSSPS